MTTGTTEAILSIFDQFKMNAVPGDRYADMGRPMLGDKINRFVMNNEPIRFSMLGYPMKSTNTISKTLGKHADMGEEVSIAQFDKFNKMVMECYGPGCEFNIVSDGYVFNDVLGAEDSVVSRYTSQVREMMQGTRARLLSIQDLTGKKDNDANRSILMKSFGVSEEELDRRIMFDQDVNILYKGMIRFMEEEFMHKDFPSRNQRNKYAKHVAKEMMLRNEAFSGMVRSEMGDHIRLSMHHSVMNGTKYSFRLLPGDMIKHSPWHCVVAVHEDGSLQTMHKSEAEKAGHQLIIKEGRPWGYRTTTT